MASSVLKGISLTWQALPRTSVRPALCLVQSRSKAKQPNQLRAKAKKDARRDMMKEMFKQQELEKLVQSASLKAAKMGEPFDPEMLNPARKRAPVKKSAKEREEEFLLVKEWSRYRMEKHKQELKALNAMVASRQRALRELKRVSPTLHSKALELKEDLFPYDCVGPTATPPKAGYMPPDSA